VARLLKGKVICYRPGVAQRVGRGVALLFPDHDTRNLPLGKTRYSFYRRLGGDRLLPRVFDKRTHTLQIIYIPHFPLNYVEIFKSF